MNIFLCEVNKGGFRIKKYICRKEKTNLEFRIWNSGFGICFIDVFAESLRYK